MAAAKGRGRGPGPGRAGPTAAAFSRGRKLSLKICSENDPEKNSYSLKYANSILFSKNTFSGYFETLDITR